MRGQLPGKTACAGLTSPLYVFMRVDAGPEIPCCLGMTLKVGHHRLLFASRTCLIGAGIGLQGNPGRGISAGLQKRALQGTSLVVWKTLCFGGSHCQATPYRAGRGSLKGRGTLPLESSRLRGAGIGLRGDPGRGTNAGLQKRALQGMEDFALPRQPALASHPCRGGGEV